MGEIAELIERLQKAEEGSRELDATLWWMFFRNNAEHTYWTAATGLPQSFPPETAYGDLPDGLGKLAVEAHAPRVTRSLDAAVALVERKLPGWTISLHINAKNIGNSCRIGGDHLIGEPCGFDHASRPICLCICIALLKALEKTNG